MAVEIQIRMPEYFSRKIAKETVTVIRTIHHAVCSADGVAAFAAPKNRFPKSCIFL